MMEAHLRVPDSAHRASAASGVMVHHDTVTDLHLRHVWAYFCDDAAGFVASHMQELGSGLFRLGRPLRPQVTATQPGRLHLDYDFSGACERLWQFTNVQFTVAQKHNAFHGNPSTNEIFDIRLQNRRCSNLTDRNFLK